MNLIHFRLEKNGGDGYLGFIAGGAGNEEHFILGNQVDGEILRVASGGNVVLSGPQVLVISWMSLVLVIL